MPSPFPGMDPYLESPELWPGVHNGLAGEIQAALNQQMQPDYVAMLEAHMVYTVPLDLPIELFSVEIRRSHIGTLVTVIEILSPANERRGEQAFDDYRRKRRDLLRTPVHLLEIDLLRADERPPLTQPVPAAPYYITLSRGERRPNVEVWPIQLADRLPAVPVPLLAPDPDVPLDLGALIASVYERGAFGRVLDYSAPPPPPALSAAEEGWLVGVVRNA